MEKDMQEMIRQNIIERWPGGQPKVKATFLDGEKQGLEIFFFQSGQKGRETFYQKGKPHGKELLWSENGVLIREFNYDNVLLQGFQKEWWIANGLKSSEFHCAKGKVEGIKKMVAHRRGVFLGT